MKTIGQQWLELAAWEHEERDSRGRWTPHGDGGVIEKITEPIGMEGARGNSREVSHDEFQRLAAEGRDRLRAIQGSPWSTDGIHRNWGAIKQRTWNEVQKPWGGATIDPRTGDDLPQGADKFAMSIKPTGLDTTSISEHSSRAAFSQAMDIALSKYGKQLSKGGSYLGVFHDDDLGRIDIDPVTVLDSLREVETIGAYTHAIGGAYRFSDGNGYWPPHVAKGASLSNSEHHWAGPGEWHRQATGIQAPHDEPEDQDGESDGATGLTTIGQQFLDLSWRDAWRTEERGRGGRWIHGLGEALQTGGQSLFEHKPDPDDPRYAADDVKMLRSAGQAVPAMYGRGLALDWDGKPPTVYPDKSRDALAEIDWAGHMHLNESVAKGISDAEKNPGKPVDTPGGYLVALHELTHAVLPDGEDRSVNGDEEAYQDPTMAHADIEEGFTELGAIEHAAEFFDAAGVGAREVTPGGEFTKGVEPGVSMDDMADELSKPEAIKSGKAWGHYPKQTAQAYDWAALIAQQRTGRPEDDPATQAEIVKVADAVNAVGTAKKPRIMAYQVLEGMGNVDQTVVDAAEKSILSAWATGSDAVNAARQAARQRLREIELEREAA